MHNSILQNMTQNPKPKTEHKTILPVETFLIRIYIL